MNTPPAGCAVLVLAAATGAVARIDPPSLLTPARLDPERVAGIHRTPDGRYRLTTQWKPYTGAGTDSQDTPVYASLELEGYGENTCGPDTGTYFREGAESVHSASNMRVADEFRGVGCGRITSSFYWTDTGSGFYIAVFTSEDVSIDCAGPAVDKVLDGIVYGFSSTGTGAYFFDADTSGDGLFLTMPADGLGGHIIIFADHYDGEILYLAAGPASPGLWGTSNNGGSPGRPGISTDPVWDDVGADGRTADGEFDPDTECLSYGLGLCPDPVTNGIVFWTDSGPQYPDCNGDGTLDIFDFLCFVNHFNEDDEFSDCDGNGVHDVFDFLCFVNCYELC
jgi:hypothetical protein